MLKPGSNLVHHSSDVAICTHTYHFSVTSPRIAPVKDLNCDAAHAPLAHKFSRGFVEIDCVAAREGKTIVVNFEELSCGPDSESSAAGPACPVGGRAVDGSVAEWGSKRGQRPVAAMITFALGVGCSANLFDCGPWHRRLIGWKWMGAAAQKNDWKKEGEMMLHQTASSQIVGLGSKKKRILSI